MYHFYFLITFDNGESYILRIRTNYVDRHAAVSRAKQVARIQFYGRRDKYELETLTLSNVLRQLCFDDNIVQLTEGVSMSVFFFQILLPGDDRTYFVRVQTKFSERKQARSKASRIAAARFDRLDFQCRPVSEDDVFGVIASGDSTDIEIFTAGCTDPGTGEQIKAMKKTIEANERTIGANEATIDDQKSEIRTLKNTIEDKDRAIVELEEKVTFVSDGKS